MLKEVLSVANDFKKETNNKRVRIISHYDSDGITSASILVKMLIRMDKEFSLRIIKGLDEDIIKEELSNHPDDVFIFSDLASGSLDYFQNLDSPIFILDHHEIDSSKLNGNIKIINPHLTESPTDNDCTGAGICYLFAKSVNPINKDLAKIAIIGMIGDRHEENPSKINKLIIEDCSDLELKKGLTLYPSTRPLKRTLEYSTSPYIPGVTGNSLGVYELLRDCNIPQDKSLLDLTQEEMSKLITSIMVKTAGSNEGESFLGNIYVLKFFNTKEDAREISTLINACSRLGFHDIAIAYCIENVKAKEQALEIYTKYKQELVSGLKIVENMDKIKGEKFVILNAKDKINDAIIGTICSMLSTPTNYKEGTILIGMAYNQDKIKVSARIAGRNGRNLKELMEKTVIEFKVDNPNSIAEVGGHKLAAGCVIERDKEDSFIEVLRKNLEVEIVKI